MSTNAMSPSLEKAFELYQNGDQLGAENLLRDHVCECESQFGKQSGEYASANYELGSLLVVMNRDRDAADALRRACEVNIPDDLGVTRDRMTYLMQLGELYDRMENYDDAEKVLRLGLELREMFYGRDHPGFAFGLEPLASVMMNRGDLDSAYEMIDETIDNFWKSGHPRVATAFPLRAVIMQRLDVLDSMFAGLEELPDPIVEDMVTQTFQIIDPDKAVESQSVLTELLDLSQRKLGPQHESTINLQTALANVGRSVGAAEGRIETIEKVIAAHESNQDREQAIVAMMGLAMAESETGNPEGAIRTYQRAVECSEVIKDHRLRAQALRNLGLLYSELKRMPDAEQTLRLATAAAKDSNDQELLGRCLVALGIFLQHEERLSEVKQLLAPALEMLETTHPDSLCARSHLIALKNNLSCGCDDLTVAISEAFRQYLVEHVPPELINDIRVNLQERGDFEIQLDSPELTEHQQERLNRALQQAHVDFMKKMNK